MLIAQKNEAKKMDYNRNVQFDLINNEKEKNKLTIDKIIEHMNKMQEINIYPKDKKEVDKNMEYIKK